MKIIKTIVGNLNSRCILKIKKKNWSGFVMPIKNNIFQKLDSFKLEKINKKKFIKVYKKDFLIPLEINNIIGVGKNFTDNYDKKLFNKFKANPDFFTMNKNAVIASNKKTILPRCYNSILVEGEIGIIIKKKCKDVSIMNAKNYIKGYIICNDYSARDLIHLQSDNTLLRKSSDGFLPIGPAIKIGYQKKNFLINTIINQKHVLTINSSQLILNFENIISMLSKHITLYKNDLICSGAGQPKPKIKRGDTVQISVEGLGNLNSRIV